MEGKVVASCPGPSSDPGKDSDWEICASNVAYPLGGCPEATASCPLLPPLRREHGGDCLCSSLNSTKVLFCGRPGVHPYVCPGHIPHAAAVVCAVRGYMWG